MINLLINRGELVTVTPRGGIDEHDNPLPDGEPFTVRALIAPAYTSLQPGKDSELDRADFTLYMPLRIKLGGEFVDTATALTGDFLVTVRGRVCTGRAKVWNMGGQGGVEVLATVATGATT